MSEKCPDKCPACGAALRELVTPTDAIFECNRTMMLTEDGWELMAWGDSENGIEECHIRWLRQQLAARDAEITRLREGLDVYLQRRYGVTIEALEFIHSLPPKHIELKPFKDALNDIARGGK